jgi:hypothetical protein
MTGQEKIVRGYTISVRGQPDHYHVSYAPRSLPSARGEGSAPRPVPPPFDVVVDFGEEVRLHWVNAPTDRDATQEDFERDAVARVRTLHEWLGRLTHLVRSIDGWARELGWSTRVIEKKLEDSQIGKYTCPALLMQEGTDRILLEPVGRTAPGAEGVVDLYLMPAYDDIATLYFCDGRWHLHSASSRSGAVATIREAAAKPLSKETLQEVLAELRQHAAWG